MVIFLPLFLMLFMLSMLRGGSNAVLLLPMLIMLGGGVVVMTIAVRDGRRRRPPSVPVLPDNRLSRRMHATLRPQRAKRTGPTPSTGVTPLRPRADRQRGRPKNPPSAG